MRNHLPLTSPPKTLCILRLSAIGDVTHVIPALGAIQQKWPETEITWVCGKFEYKFLRILEGVNFVVFDKKAGFKEYINLWRSLKNKRFDVLLHMQVSARANMASMTINADIKLGWDQARSRDFHSLFINQRIESAVQQHQTQGFLSFARALGIAAIEPVWTIPLTDNARNFVNKFISSETPYIVISACSSHKLRNWKAESYAQLADYAVEKHGLQVVLSGGPSQIESEMAEQIMSFMHNNVINLVAKDTLEQLVGLLKSATAVISPDSGPAHIANAVGVPVIGLYACTWSRRSGPYNSLEYCVDKFELAAENFSGSTANSLKWGTKIEKPGVMDLITVDEVCEKLDKVISDRSNLTKTDDRE